MNFKTISRPLIHSSKQKDAEFQCYYRPRTLSNVLLSSANTLLFLLPQNKWNTVLRFTEDALRLAPNDPIWLAGHAQAQSKIQEISQRESRTGGEMTFIILKCTKNINQIKRIQHKPHLMKPQSVARIYAMTWTITFEEAVLVARKRLSYHAGRHVHIVMVTVRNLVRHRRLCVVPSVVVQVRFVRWGTSISASSWMWQGVSTAGVKAGWLRLLRKVSWPGSAHVKRRRILVNILLALMMASMCGWLVRVGVRCTWWNTRNLYTVPTVQATHSSNVRVTILFMSWESTPHRLHGDKVKVPTIDGPLADLKIPPGTPGDTSFRLKGWASQSFIAVHAATST